MEKAKLMQLEIEQKRKLPQNVKENIKTNIFHTLIAAVIIVAYLVAINLMYYKFEHNIFEQYMKYFALGIIIITVIDIEIAYRKDSKKLALIGVELLTCGVLSLYIPYIYLHTNAYLRNMIMILPAALLIYYAFKSYVIFKQNQFKHRNNLSDIKDLVKDDERKGYLEEDSKKTYRAKLEEEEEIRKAIIKKQKIKTVQKEQAKKALKEKEQKTKKTTNVKNTKQKIKKK